MEDQQQHASSSTGSSSTSGSSSGSSTNVSKIYVGGLSREITQQDLENCFKQFGEVTIVALFKGPPVGPPKAFAFVSFASSTSVDSVLNSGPLLINGAPIEVNNSTSNGPQCLKKIFVDGIGDNTTEADLSNYFAKFGTVTNVEFSFERRSRRRKPFCFVNFDEEVTVYRVCRQPKHKIGSKLCDVKMATTKLYRQSGVSTLGQGRRPTRRPNPNIGNPRRAWPLY